MARRRSARPSPRRARRWRRSPGLEREKRSAVDLIAFYRGEAPDDLGRKLRGIWGWDSGLVDTCHNYIHVLFPLKEPSQFNLHAPLLDDATAERFRSDPVIQANLLRSFNVMLRFYGFRMDDNTGEV